ncbi:MAG: hypothetical protein ACKVQA_09550 [Burkholderiales bacterium]
MTKLSSTTTPAERRFCPYCNGYKEGKFRLAGNKRTTPMCEACYQGRRNGTFRSKNVAKDDAASAGSASSSHDSA